MLIFASTIHVLLCIFMIFVILLQPGKDAGMGSALGGGAATSAFGGRGAVTFLGKVTAVCAIGFFLTSLGLSFVGMKSSVASKLAVEAPVKKADKKEEAAAPAPKKEEGAAKAEGVQQGDKDSAAKAPDPTPAPNPAPTGPH